MDGTYRISRAARHRRIAMEPVKARAIEAPDNSHPAVRFRGTSPIGIDTTGFRTTTEKAFTGFSEDELAILHGVIPQPVEPGTKIRGLSGGGPFLSDASAEGWLAGPASRLVPRRAGRSRTN